MRRTTAAQRSGELSILAGCCVWLVHSSGCRALLLRARRRLVGGMAVRRDLDGLTGTPLRPLLILLAVVPVPVPVPVRIGPSRGSHVVHGAEEAATDAAEIFHRVLDLLLASRIGPYDKDRATCR